MKKTLAILVALLILAPAAHAGLIGFTNTAGNFFEIERLPAMRAQIRLTQYKTLLAYQNGLGQFDASRTLQVNLPTLAAELAKNANATKSIRRNYLLAVFAALKAVAGYEDLVPVVQ